jgi:hypothetical protein
VNRAARLNAQQLFAAVGSCAAEKQAFELSLLIVEGQVRAMTDMELLAPKTEADKLLVGNLYGQNFYVTGGVGDRELYRDPVKAQNLFDRIESWVPELPSDYDPGWHYRRRPSETAYSDSIKYLKSVRLAQLRNYAMLVRDSEYYAAESELEDLKKRNPKGIVTGSNDGNRSAELFQIMNRVIERIGRPEMPPERPFVFTPDPDADFKQVFVGFNGPEHGGATLIQSRSEATASWLSSSLSVHDLDRILLQVNFDSKS